MSALAWTLVPREQPSRQAVILVPLATIVLTVLCSMVLFTALGASPGIALYSFFIDPFSSAYSISEILIKASPLILIAQGLAIGFRAKVWNIGAEGQLVIGAIAASLVPIAWSESSNVLMLPAMILLGVLGGIPFVLGYKDRDFGPDFPFAFRAPATDEPLDIDALLEFFDAVHTEQPDYRIAMRQFAETCLSWEAKLTPVASYLHAYCQPKAGRECA